MVSERYDRSAFLLTNKLTDPYFKSQEDIRPFFEKQLKWCGVDYFDFYLMHAQDHSNKGGSLVNLPEDADKILRDLNGGSNASYAIRFAASFPNIAVVLSGMSDMPQMTDNISAMKDFISLSEAEHAAVRKVCDIFKGLNLIPCTACRYCIEESECPRGIRIPDLFAALNAHEAFHNWNTGYYYDNIITGNKIKCL